MLDVRKEMNFCRKVGLPMLGVVENMATFVCPKCSKESVVLPSTSGGAPALAASAGVPLLGRVPLDPRVGRACDEGENVFDEAESAATGSPAVAEYRQIVTKLKTLLKKS